jgi:di/tricarboxylate transporter
VVVVAVRAGIAPSKLLIPLAFAASAGSLLTLTGTPVNIVVSEAAVAAGGREFGFFEFALAGIPLVVCTVVIVALGGGRLLPSRAAERLADLAPIRARTLRPSATATTSTSTPAACSARARASPRCSSRPVRASSGARRRRA